MYPAVFTALALAVGAPGAKDPPKKEASVVGEWAVESAVIGGRRDDPPPGTTWALAADGKSVFAIPGGADSAAGTYTTDPKKDPAWVDFSAGPKGTPMRGIYKRDGDTLVLCLALKVDGERPTAFESEAGAQVILITLGKARKKE
jgi:uncharacterized protein (TIGR03067 family)